MENMQSYYKQLYEIWNIQLFFILISFSWLRWLFYCIVVYLLF